MSAGESAGRQPIPPGQVSTIRGRYQIPGLVWLTRLLMPLGFVAAVLDGDAGIALGTAVVVAVVAAPLLRVGWLTFRWRQERDTRFVLVGCGVLGVVVVGVVLAALGVGA
ncbi:MAG: hypothetical protein U5K30_12055 [Acidimicrobiales bacterium]|nr:hypothetical protein [Acidimicrobiales bacterium]